MSLFLCKLWPYLAGGLIGWLLSGWLARKLKYGEPPTEKIIEKKVEVQKLVDNPKHIERISLLETENAEVSTLRSQLATFQKSKSQTVEKMVDNPEHLKRISILEKENAEIAGLRSQISKLESSNSQTVGKSTGAEKIIDNPEHIKRISLLEKENAQISSLQAKLKGFEGQGSSNSDQINRIADLEKQLANSGKTQKIDLKAARAAGISIKSENDFAAIEGIGPKINDIIQAEGIGSFYALSNTNSADIKNMLDDAGPRYRMANPGTWPDQANLAANNRWPALKALQDVLDGGVYPSGSSKSTSKASDGASDKSADQTKRINKLEKELEKYKNKAKSEYKLDLDAAKSFGFNLKNIGKNGQHDFTAIEGIGPKINELIHNDDIHTYAALASTDVSTIQKILDVAGSRYSFADPGTWPAQSDMAANNKWAELKKWQDELDGGIA